MEICVHGELGWVTLGPETRLCVVLWYLPPKLQKRKRSKTLSLSQELCPRCVLYHLYTIFTPDFCREESIEPDLTHYFLYDKTQKTRKGEKEEKEGRKKGEERIVQELCVT